MRRKGSWVYPGIVLFLGIVVAIGFGLWSANTREAMPEALMSLVSDSDVEVQVDPRLVFLPEGKKPSTGLIFYPGGLVDPFAYAPAGHAIAKAGYLVVIPKMPLNLAFLGVNSASEIMGLYPGITRWVMGGHSLGGSMAASYVDRNPGEIAGLILWASYPAGSDDLSDQRIPVASIYGTMDGLTTPEEIFASRSLLPEDADFVPIEGGNHAQFGWYGLQGGDNPASINRDTQQSQIVTATLGLLSQLDE